MKNALLVGSGLAVGLLAALAATLPQAEARARAQAGPMGGNGAEGPGMIVATGGSTNNQNDLLWIVTKVKPAGGAPARTVLAMYKSERNGDHFSLRSVRMIDADLRAVDLQAAGKELTVKQVLQALPAADQAELNPQPAAPQPRNP